LALIIVLMVYTNPSDAVVMRHDVEKKHYQVDQAPAYIVNMPSEGQGVLIAPQWILTVAHVISPGDRGKTLLIAGKEHRIEKVVRHPDYKSLPSSLGQGDAKPLMAYQRTRKDIALIKLATVVDGVRPIAFFEGSDEQGKMITGYGRGATGTGLTGALFKTKALKQMNQFQNIIDVADDRWLFYRFDNSPQALALEGMSGSGDSGGPAIITQNNKPYLVGLTAWSTYEGDFADYIPSVYGQSGVLVRVSSYRDWIQATINSKNDALDDFIVTQMSKSNVQGMRLIIVKDQKVVKTASYGETKLEGTTAIQNSAVMAIKAISQHFDTINTNPLVAKGKVASSALYWDYLADIPLPLSWQVNVRVEHPVIVSTGSNQISVFIYPQDNLSIVRLGNAIGAMPVNFNDEIAGFYDPSMQALRGYDLVGPVKTLWRELEIVGYKNALKVAQKLQQTLQVKFEENDLNDWGYMMLGRNRAQKALEVFRVNTVLFPTSANTYDSLAETYASLGLNKQAIKHYESALKLTPINGDTQYLRTTIKALKAKR
jgi:hypothetical protein